jgi:TolA-binding protein
MMIRSVIELRALAAACALSLSAAGVSAQAISLPLGGMLGTTELATWSKNNFDELRREIDRLRADTRRLTETADALTKALDFERKQSVADAERTSALLLEARAQAQAQARELQELKADSDRRLQELNAQMEQRISGIATVVQQRLGQTNAGLSKLEGDSAALRSEFNGLQTLVTELQGDRRQLVSDLLRLQADQKNLQTTVTQLESRKSEIEAMQKELSQSRESSQLALNKAIEDRDAKLAEIRKELDQAKLDFQSQVAAAKNELTSQVTDTKKEVTEIRRSTAPVSVEIDGRTFEALPAERDGYLAAIGRVMNAPKAKAPREEYEAARADLQKFLDSSAHPGFRGSSFYWLGMAQVGAGQCREALASFEEMRKLVDTARHPRYPSAMLQKATCQMVLKEPQERINRSVKELIDQFPGSPEADAARALLPAPRRNR